MNEQEYLRALRNALRNLYDPTALRRNPLEALLNPRGQVQGLQEALRSAVNALSPGRGASMQSDARRTHHILQHRYVEQFSQAEVASSLGLSARQLRRQEQLAIRTLGEYLRATQHLAIDPAPQDAEGAEQEEIEVEAEVEVGSATPNEHDNDYQAELDLVHQSGAHTVEDVGAVVTAALQTLKPLLAELGVTVAHHAAPDLPPVTVNAMALRQTVMIALAAVARQAAGGRLLVESTLGGSASSADDGGTRAIRVRIRPDGERSVGTHTGQFSTVESGTVESGTGQSDRVQSGTVHTDRMQGQTVGESLHMAQRLAALSGATLTAGDGGDSSDTNPRAGVTLRVPVAEPETVLVIDDNEDALLLVQRYLTGTPWRTIVARDPAEGLALAQQHAPSLILCDVMLPGMDGWEMLARLRRHPATEGIPVVICTILPEEQLAWALGASGFLRKPLAREELLLTLQTTARK